MTLNKETEPRKLYWIRIITIKLWFNRSFCLFVYFFSVSEKKQPFAHYSISLFVIISQKNFCLCQLEEFLISIRSWKNIHSWYSFLKNVLNFKIFKEFLFFNFENKYYFLVLKYDSVRYIYIQVENSLITSMKDIDVASILCRLLFISLCQIIFIPYLGVSFIVLILIIYNFLLLRSVILELSNPLIHSRWLVGGMVGVFFRVI